MIGVVYKISFPDGYFYIGRTNDLIRRIKQHCEHPSHQIKLKLDGFISCPKLLMDRVVVIYEGSNYIHEEKKILWDSKFDKNLLNIKIPVVNPYLKKDLYLKKIKELKDNGRFHINITEETKVNFELYMSKLKMSSDELIEFFIRNENRRLKEIQM